MKSELSAERKVELLEMGRRLISGRGNQLTRSEWSQVVAALFPGGKAANTAQARELIEALPKSWLKERSKGAPTRFWQLWATFEALMERELQSEELRFVVGWMDRMLLVKAKLGAKSDRPQNLSSSKNKRGRPS